MRHGFGAFLQGDLRLPSGDQRARDRRAEQVAAFVQGIATQHRKHVFLDEGFPEIFDMDFFYAERSRFGLDGLQIFALPEISAKRDDLGVVRLLEPFQDHGSVQPARIGQHDFLDGFPFHDVPVTCNLSSVRGVGRVSPSACAIDFPLDRSRQTEVHRARPS